MGDAVKETEEINKFFDDNVEDYETKHYGSAVRSFMTVRQQRVLEFVDALGLPAGARALDAGCGPGYLLEQLARRALQVSGMDGAEGMLRSAKARVDAIPPRFPADFKQGDIEKLPYEDASFDLVCSTGVIEYLKDDTQVLAEMYRVLKPGGYLILPVTNLWSPINYLDFIIEFLKRRSWVRGPFNFIWTRMGHGPVLPRHFHVRKHSPAKFRHALATSGFTLKDSIYFYFLPWPRPLDQLMPKISASLGNRLEKLGRSKFGFAAEGYLSLCQKI